jgi:hypothetical protein
MPPRAFFEMKMRAHFEHIHTERLQPVFRGKDVVPEGSNKVCRHVKCYVCTWQYWLWKGLLVVLLRSMAITDVNDRMHIVWTISNSITKHGNH